METRRLGRLSADRGLDVLTLFLADVQSGFGPFIAIYLVTNHWTEADVGAVLGIGTAVAMIAQVPAGIAIDAIPLKRGATLLALLAVLASAVLLALFPSWLPVAGAEVLHGVATCMLLPAVAAVTLSRVGRAAFPLRLGRNVRFMAIGNAIGAVLMGYAGYKLSPAAPLWIAAASTVPAILALLALPPRHPTQPRPPRRRAREATGEGFGVLLDRRLLLFVVCVVLFQAANAFILPLASARLVRQGDESSFLVLAASALVSQAIVALLAPRFGDGAERWGRRRMLMIGFAAVPLHALILAIFSGAPFVVGTQVLDGIGGAMFGVLYQLVAADVTMGTNRFNLAMGVFGLAIGLGGTLGNVVGGRIAEAYGDSAAFLALAAAGLAGLLAVVFLMPETRVAHEEDGARPAQP